MVQRDLKQLRQTERIHQDECIQSAVDRSMPSAAERKTATRISQTLKTLCCIDFSKIHTFQISNTVIYRSNIAFNKIQTTLMAKNHQATNVNVTNEPQVSMGFCHILPTLSINTKL